MLLRYIFINACTVLASGSGSGELACKCNRSVECSIEGKLIGQSEAWVFLKVLMLVLYRIIRLFSVMWLVWNSSVLSCSQMRRLILDQAAALWCKELSVRISPTQLHNLFPQRRVILDYWVLVFRISFLPRQPGGGRKVRQTGSENHSLIMSAYCSSIIIGDTLTSEFIVSSLPFLFL